MTGYQIKKALDSFEIIIDTREQATDKLANRTKDFGCSYSRATLDYGDYTFNVTYPDGSKLYDVSERVKPKVVIERKLNLDELAMCLGHGRNRFIKEFERAKENGASVYLLVENGGWDEIISDKYKSWMDTRTFMGNLTMLQARYDIKIVFVNDYNSGIVIKNILYHEAVEMIRREESKWQV